LWGTQRKKRRTKKRTRTEVDFNAIVREEGEDQREISLQGAADAFLRKSSRTRYYINISTTILNFFEKIKNTDPEMHAK
jgi:hypothetical protein